MRRIYPAFVTLIGGLGLGLALTYLIGVVLAFVPGWEDWADFFVPRALYLVLLPYVLLIAHMVLRNHVGRFLLGRQAFEEAVQYAGKRMKASLIRSRREVANQRIVCARAHIGLGKYGEARSILEGADDEYPGSYAVEARRWKMELALRDDDRQRADELAVEDANDEKSARGQLAALLACQAELALRRGDKERYQEWIEEAMWEDASHPRVRMSRALAMAAYEAEDESSDEVLDLLEELREPMAQLIPARGAEIDALGARILRRRGRQQEAQTLLEGVEQKPQDRWATKVVEETRDRGGA